MRTRRWRWVKPVVVVATSLIIISGLTVCGLYWHFNRDLPSDLQTIRDYRPPILTEVYADDGRVVGEFYIQRRMIVPLAQIPPYVLHAFIAAEDQYFYYHSGVDPVGIVRALIKNLRSHEVVQGGSTITQQVGRMLFLTRERTYSRKIKETILAFRLERELTKEDILFLYLNQVYLGNGAYGVQAASQNYFNKDVGGLDLAEAAMLAGLPKAPSAYSPQTDFATAKNRQLYVLNRMVQDGWITQDEADLAWGEPIRLVPVDNKNLAIAPYFVESVRQAVMKKYSADQLYTGGLRIFTTMDVMMQQAAQEAVREGLDALDKQQGFRGPELHLDTEDDWVEFQRRQMQALRNETAGWPPAPGLRAGKRYAALVVRTDPAIDVTIGRFRGVVDEGLSAWATRSSPGPDVIVTRPLREHLTPGDVIRVRVTGGSPRRYTVAIDQEPRVESALIALNPKTGFVKAMVGGYDFTRSQYNRAVQAQRQPGSSFKPMLYAAAIDHGYTELSVVLDGPVAFRGTNGRMWSPRNYRNKYLGPQPLRNALAQSLNTVSVRLLADVGMDETIAYARRLGITSPIPRNMTIALGSMSVTPVEMVRAYTVFAAGGRRIEPVFIKRIEDRYGRVLEDNTRLNAFSDDPPQADQDPLPAGYALSPATAYIMTDLLKNVVLTGTARRANVLNRPLAGKTGTTDDYGDAWFIGYAPDLVAGVWVGFDNHQPLGKEQTGGRVALPIWVRFMGEALKTVPIRDFDIPPGVVFVRVGPEGQSPVTLAGAPIPGVDIPFKRPTVAASPVERQERRVF
ncbi:MAG: PBP1A family penicillin-binding protein [Candidatus Latescibacteria bacterium]|nr:PBP1A family penicillin-binding protein [Candidatus Latescibacterota bacterium]